MPKWEYHQRTRFRGLRGAFSLQAGEWSPGPTEWASWLTEMGEMGWELVAVVAGSREGGLGVAGTSTEELWVFKRPKTYM
jgi:hypothetical protein